MWYLSINLIIYPFHSVIYRLVVLLYERAGLEANHRAALSQAQGVSRELQRRLDEAINDDKPDVSKMYDIISNKIIVSC